MVRMKLLLGFEVWFGISLMVRVKFSFHVTGMDEGEGHFIFMVRVRLMVQVLMRSWLCLELDLAFRVWMRFRFSFRIMVTGGCGSRLKSGDCLGLGLG